jgi:hypothetical protein
VQSVSRYFRKVPGVFSACLGPPGSIRLVSVENKKNHVKLSLFWFALRPAGAGGRRPLARPFREEYSAARAFSLRGRILPRREKKAPKNIYHRFTRNRKISGGRFQLIIFFSAFS